ncbi:hypothetical protein CDAR_437801 [Caerostris darwini]|uniref:Uncharacterized protein n=1 Tax=Caerostris darwini TaxID=1538125 RepID=A0AAV4NT78_9ARAC|nr:hypothetical protein CDAR_437801 [Caerostris darwini]
MDSFLLSFSVAGWSFYSNVMIDAAVATTGNRNRLPSEGEAIHYLEQKASAKPCFPCPLALPAPVGLSVAYTFGTQCPLFITHRGYSRHQSSPSVNSRHQTSPSGYSHHILLEFNVHCSTLIAAIRILHHHQAIRGIFFRKTMSTYR